ncbi:hypothetical protein MRX96_046741 [Rhipicephalus microplus]|uniref:Uncharacterized protein n=1 Tax=Rhipicephalus microplus TaxID=6941 RepID=A0A9J6EW69_RHIMP|nr:hypothetical protein HPB51_001686 [Rhipicephalus microplus]
MPLEPSRSSLRRISQRHTPRTHTPCLACRGSANTLLTPRAVFSGLSPKKPTPAPPRPRAHWRRRLAAKPTPVSRLPTRGARLWECARARSHAHSLRPRTRRCASAEHDAQLSCLPSPPSRLRWSLLPQQQLAEHRQWHSLTREELCSQALRRRRQASPFNCATKGSPNSLLLCRLFANAAGEVYLTNIGEEFETSRSARNFKARFVLVGRTIRSNASKKGSE